LAAAAAVAIARSSAVDLAAVAVVTARVSGVGNKTRVA